MIIPRISKRKITDIKKIGDEYLEIYFEKGDTEYWAGQYVSVKVSEIGERRSYSLASFPNEEGDLRICVDTSPRGKGSLYLMSLKVGDEIETLMPMGRFVLSEDEITKVFIATGSGIVPMRSMIGQYLSSGGQQKVKLHWGMRHEHLFWTEDFSSREKKYPNFDYDVTISKPLGEWKGCVGRVTDCLVNHYDTFEGMEFYLCGSQAMINDVTQYLAEKGVTPEKIHFEKFY